MSITEADRLEITDEILMRQVHPTFMQQEGRLWSGAFTPTVADKGMLSADRESLISPKDAYERYIKSKALVEGGGTWGVTVSEFNDIGLLSYSDPLPGNAAHSLVDFSAQGPEKEKGLGKLAYVRASARGRLHP